MTPMRNSNLFQTSADKNVVSVSQNTLLKQVLLRVHFGETHWYFGLTDDGPVHTRKTNLILAATLGSLSIEFDLER